MEWNKGAVKRIIGIGVGIAVIGTVGAMMSRNARNGGWILGECKPGAEMLSKNEEFPILLDLIADKPAWVESAEDVFVWADDNGDGFICAMGEDSVTIEDNRLAGLCPGDFELREEGVNYDIGAYDTEDRNDDGFICQQITQGGTGVVIDDNAVPAATQRR